MKKSCKKKQNKEKHDVLVVLGYDMTMFVKGSITTKRQKEIILPVLYVICEKKISYFNLSLKFLFFIAFSYFLPTKYDMQEKIYSFNMSVWLVLPGETIYEKDITRGCIEQWYISFQTKLILTCNFFWIELSM